MVGERIMPAVESGIKAGDLRQVRPPRPQRPDRRQVVWLMQRRQRHIALEFRQDLRVDQYRPVIVGPAMDDPMSDGDELDLLRLEQPGTGG